MNFVINNWYLIAAALVSGGMLLWPLVRRSGGSSAVTPLEAVQLINQRNAIVIDVRSEAAFAAGSLTGARNIPVATLDARIADIARFKARPAIVVCETGQTSTKALAALKTAGFDEAHPLAGGLAAWKQAGLPLVGAPRETPRAPPKDRAREGRNEIRAKDRNKGMKTAPRPRAQPAIEAPVTASEALNGRDVLEADALPGASGTEAPATATPDRVKEVT